MGSCVARGPARSPADALSEEGRKVILSQLVPFVPWAQGEEHGACFAASQGLKPWGAVQYAQGDVHSVLLKHWSLQSPLCSSSHPLPSLGTSEMRGNSLLHCSSFCNNTAYIPEEDGGEMYPWCQKGKIQAGVPRSLLVCLESLTFP